MLSKLELVLSSTRNVSNKLINWNEYSLRTLFFGTNETSLLLKVLTLGVGLNIRELESSLILLLSLSLFWACNTLVVLRYSSNDVTSPRPCINSWVTMNLNE
eukprot:NODE_886_length_3442_cov_0.414897.p4 type:complete len:102 gc:universal NODE_886_length_3442_cov_0.414897:1820-2125(+)